MAQDDGAPSTSGITYRQVHPHPRILGVGSRQAGTLPHVAWASQSGCPAGSSQARWTGNRSVAHGVSGRYRSPLGVGSKPGINRAPPPRRERPSPPSAAATLGGGPGGHCWRCPRPVGVGCARMRWGYWARKPRHCVARRVVHRRYPAGRRPCRAGHRLRTCTEPDPPAMLGWVASAPTPCAVALP